MLLLVLQSIMLLKGLVTYVVLLALMPYLLPIPAENNVIDAMRVFAEHGQEITLTLHNSSFGSLTSGGGNQVSVFADYVLNDNLIAGQTINAVMEVYAPNGTLIRTSSYPDGFVAQSTGGIGGLETTINDPMVQSVRANITFRDLDKTQMLSNNLEVNLNLDEEGAATAGEDVGIEEDTLFETDQETSLPQQPDQEGGASEDEIDEEESQDVESTIPSVPIG